MKITTWIKYEESYLPPRCRKLRYMECEEYVDINLREAALDDLQLAFEDNSYEGKGKIYFYKGKLWAQAKLHNPSWAAEHGITTALENLVDTNKRCSHYFRFAYDRERYGRDTSRKGVLKDARADMRRYLLVDGVLFEQTSEPRYCICTFGLGHNHGSTALFVDYRYNPNISRNAYFSALEGAEAVAAAKRTALARRDTDSMDRIKAHITVFMPELVKVKPRRQHGKGNPLINTFNQITAAAPDVITAGLLCIGAAQMVG